MSMIEEVFTANNLQAGDYFLADNIHGLTGIKYVVRIDLIFRDRIRLRMRHYRSNGKQSALFTFTLLLHQSIHKIPNPQSSI